MFIARNMSSTVVVASLLQAVRYTDCEVHGSSQGRSQGSVSRAQKTIVLYSYINRVWDVVDQMTLYIRSKDADRRRNRGTPW